MLDIPQGGEGFLGASITCPLDLYFSLKNNCTEHPKLFKLGLEIKSAAANFTYINTFVRL